MLNLIIIIINHNCLKMTQLIQSNSWHIHALMLLQETHIRSVDDTLRFDIPKEITNALIEPLLKYAAMEADESIRESIFNNPTLNSLILSLSDGDKYNLIQTIQTAIIQYGRPSDFDRSDEFFQFHTIVESDGFINSRGGIHSLSEDKIKISVKENFLKQCIENNSRHYILLAQYVKIFSQKERKNITEWVNFFTENNIAIPSTGLNAFDGKTHLAAELIEAGASINSFIQYLDTQKESSFSHDDCQHILFQCAKFNRIDILNNLFKNHHQFFKIDVPKNLQPSEQSSFELEERLSFIYALVNTLDEKNILNFQTDYPNILSWAADNLFRKEEIGAFIEIAKDSLVQMLEDEDEHQSNPWSPTLSTSTDLFLTKAIIPLLERKKLLYEVGSSSTPNARSENAL